MDSEIGVIRKKYTRADYPKRYVESVMKQFSEKTSSPQRGNVTNEQQKHLFQLEYHIGRKMRQRLKHS